MDNMYLQYFMNYAIKTVITSIFFSLITQMNRLSSLQSFRCSLLQLFLQVVSRKTLQLCFV